MKPKQWLTLCGLGFLLCLPARADEGMWLPHQMKDLDLQSQGLRLDPADLYRTDGTGLMSAVVYLGGGTGEFVSRRGLILTNHHVAFGALQRASTPESDLIQNGFLAQTKAEELRAQGYIADVLLGYDDVTDEVESRLNPGMTYRQRFDALDKTSKELIAEAERSGPDIRAVFRAMYSGNAYYVFRFKRIKDIRLVYAPPRDLGNFGGDIDNWMWPRHTCDFTFLRAYVSPEDIGVDFSPENVPYEPKSWLKISLAGIKQDDFSFVMGYPGRTYRHTTLSELEFDISGLRNRMDLYAELIDFLERAGEPHRDIQIKYASTIKGLNNALKNYQGKIEGLDRIGLLGKKKEAEETFRAWVDAEPSRKDQYGRVLEDIAAFMREYREHSSRTDRLETLFSARLGPAVLSHAHTILRAVEERQRPDIDREAAFQERNLPYIRQQLELADRRFDPAVDRSLFAHHLKRLAGEADADIPEALRPLLNRNSDSAIKEYTADLYSRTRLLDTAKRLELLDVDPAALESLDDPMIDLAAGLEEEMKSLRESGKSLTQKHTDLKKIYLEARLLQTGNRIAPDANSTIRFTYGLIRGYEPRDAVTFRPQTTLRGVLDKDTGEFPFRVPEALKSLHEAGDFGPYVDERLGDIPVCFLNTTNVTGGNSGSPTLNADGHIIGIIFDMTYESVTGDYFVIPELQRTISVDIRYVLFITDKFAGAHHIIDELELEGGNFASDF